jgi:hypothetical protein
MVGQRTLNPPILVRIQAREPNGIEFRTAVPTIKLYAVLPRLTATLTATCRNTGRNINPSVVIPAVVMITWLFGRSFG